MEALASSQKNKNIPFGIVYESDLGESIHQYSIRAFPTYVLFQNGGRETNRVEGVNMSAVEAMIAGAGPVGMESLPGGQTLSGGSSGGTAAAAALSPAEARAARLAKLGGAATPAPAPVVEDDAAPKTTTDKKEDVEMKDAPQPPETTSAPATADGDAKMEDATAATTTSSTTESPEMIDPTADLDPEVVKTLTDSMGFSKIRAQKGLLNGNARTVEAAVEWLMEHQEDEGIDDPIPLQPKSNNDGGVAQSYKCNECGKILSNMANLELHANKTGHSDFEESTQAVKPLTPEEKAQKIAEIKELLKAKRAEREQVEKVDDVAREKNRRATGQLMAKTREQMEIDARKRDALIKKKEKEAARLEKKRIMAELEKDKLERKANKGKLHSRLGVDGYAPSAIQYDQDADNNNGGDSSSTPAKKKSATASVAKIDEYIAKVSSYKAGGDGGKCLKLLKVYVGNVVDNPTEEKYKSINTDSKAYKTKAKPFVGAKALLMAVGFSPNEAGDAMVLKDDADPEVLATTKTKLEAALAAY